MRKALKIFIIAGIAGSLVSCNKFEQENDFVELGDVISLTKTIIVGEIATKAGGTTECKIALDADYSLSQDKIVDYSVSFADGVDFEGMTDSQLMDLFDEKIKEEFGANYLDLTVLEGTDSKSTKGDIFSKLSGCLTGCKNNYVKGDGRGKCRAVCWGDATKEFIVEVVIPALTVYAALHKK